MKIIFLLPFLAILFGVSIPSVFAEVGSNYDRSVIGQDNTGNDIIQWTSHYDRIFHNGQYNDYLFNDNPTSLSVETQYSSITLNKASCAFSFHNKGLLQNNPTPLFNDSIIAYNMIKDSYNWNSVTQINDAVCQPYFDASTVSLVAKKQVNGIGLMEYKYTFQNGIWKTSLEVTNLTGLTNRVFGFNQVINLNRDSVFFGGVQRNLDNLNGTVLDRNWILNNEGKVINFLNGYNFDFDIALDYLDSINIIDTGPNSSQLVFHFMNNNSVLLPNQKLILDPTYGPTSATAKTVRTSTSISASCAAGSTTNTNTFDIYKSISTNNDLCNLSVPRWDISSIADGSVISSITVGFGVSTVTNMGTQTCAYKPMQIDPSTGSAANLFADAVNGTTYATDGGCQTVGAGKSIALSSQARHDLQNILGNGTDWLSYGISFTSMTRDASAHQTEGVTAPGPYDVTLTIVYIDEVATTTTIEADSGIIGDTARITSSVGILTGLPTPVNITSVKLIVNGTIIDTNSTEISDTPPFTVDYGPYWYRMISGNIYNVTISMTATNATGTVSNSTSIYIQREYDPSYSPAQQNPTTQGNVNATVSRFDSEDGILLKVNRVGGTLGDTWQIECIAQTNSQAAQTKNQTQAWSGTWSNTTNTGYFNTTWTGFANSHAYITCFNDSILFTLTDFTSSSLALLGIQLFDESYGSMLGVPVGVFFLVLTAGMANKRTAPTFIIVVTGIAGTMATIGFFTFEPLVWGLALVTAMLGIFVNQKIF